MQQVNQRQNKLRCFDEINPCCYRLSQSRMLPWSPKGFKSINRDPYSHLSGCPKRLQSRNFKSLPWDQWVFIHFPCVLITSHPWWCRIYLRNNCRFSFLWGHSQKTWHYSSRCTAFFPQKKRWSRSRCLISIKMWQFIEDVSLPSSEKSGDTGAAALYGRKHIP